MNCQLFPFNLGIISVTYAAFCNKSPCWHESYMKDDATLYFSCMRVEIFCQLFILVMSFLNMTVSLGISLGSVGNVEKILCAFSFFFTLEL